MCKRIRKRCAIIGAGASGLPAARWSLAYGVEPVVFERMDKIGGLWLYQPAETDLGSVMKSTIINTSKEMTAYSDFPPPATFANFMHNRQMLRYFEMYAQHHQLYPHIRFNHTVLGIERSPDYKQTGQWVVKFVDGDGKLKEETFDCVLLCQGHHAKPNLLNTDWEGVELFKGKVIHSHSYKDHVGYEDTVNVVVGVGNSAVDVAVELSRIGRQAYLSTRRGAWVVNRVGTNGQPLDMELTKRFSTIHLGKILPTSLKEWMWLSRLQYRFDHAKYGLMPKHSVFSQHATVNDELPNRIISGTVVVKPNIKRFTQRGVVWEDGTENEVDNVILATGYLFDFDLVERGELIPVEGNRARLYKNMYPVDLFDHNSLAVIGLIQVLKIYRVRQKYDH